MVLQQQSDVTLWGWADPGEKIKITTSWNNQTDSVVTTRDSNWKIQVSTPRAGGPYTITLKGLNTIILQNVLIGEVWVCSGQSNMAWGMDRYLPDDADERRAFDHPNIRLFHVPRATSAHPQDHLSAEWEICTAESLAKFSAVAYYFADKLQDHLDVPVGLINSSWGGTPAEAWTPAEAVMRNETLNRAAIEKLSESGAPKAPGVIYNAMIHPVISFNIAGTLWYQGESNVGTYSSYDLLMTTMIDSWRKAWDKEFPFYYVQIAPFEYGTKDVGALLREQQTRTLAQPKTGMVVITDLVHDIKDIHPTNKRDVGLRLANLALADTYEQNIPGAKSPMFKSMEVTGSKAILFFDNAPNGFQIIGGKKVTEFFIAGQDKVFLPADVKIEKDRIIVSNRKIKKPVAVRFAFSNAAVSNLFSKEGLPVGPFRTDEW